MRRYIDITWKKYGRLSVIKYVGNNISQDALWECECECGKILVVCGSSLRNGHTKSCGCYHYDKCSERLTKHGHSDTRVYRIWVSMRSRCNHKENNEYMNYGGRGINVCTEWNDFENFYKWAMVNGYQDDLTIDRIDNDRGYSPDNCRWVNRSIQNKNTSRVHKIFDGEKYYTASEVARMVGVSRSVVSKWCRDGEVKTLQDAVKRRNAINNGRYKKRLSEL